MATTLQITSGPLTSKVTTANDTKAQNILTNFADAIGAPPEATPQQKLDAVTKHLAEYMQTSARQRWFQKESADLQAQADADVSWEMPAP